ncbi:family 20 glycosylhydrolase [Streptomyces sp. 3MP-14]|uniref:Family 20 glycosylhydrolase n=1 Tax=Streptomyces mimosae TaxID=2586635 RepID=A0A5N6AAM9_9ACTN|nr:MULTISPECIES: glycoside hydrolase family 20 protein [Streptomyces]KAB8165315.1 family 20 glycosylhydrolase [Streptomyces mimosae]KAB8175947.1 family 20 glycosylhydrolase [Streptomyces sp. 3MP-14]
MRQAPWRIAALAGAVALIAVALVLTATSPSGDPHDSAGTRQPRGVGESPATPLPTGPNEAPRTVPSVRSFEEAPGPGWAPADSTRVVTDPDGPLTDEADRLADELDVERSDEDPGAGDVELVLDRDADCGAEGYRLETDDQRVTITAETPAGAFYGTVTLTQAVRDQGGIAQGTVEDRPDRPQRGLSLDIARKHYDAEWIEARLREMAELKLNQLQLHFSDDQGFRIESESHPEVVSEDHLTKDQVRDLIRLAQSLHIDVIPEIDSPGHLGAVLAAHPDLQLRERDGSATPGAIDIANPDAGEIVDDLLREYAELFPSDYFHLGGDEYAALFKSDPDAAYPGLAEAARERFGDDATVTDLATGWLNDRADAARDAGKTPQVWNDGMHAGGEVQPDQEREVTYWTGREVGAREPVEYLEGGWPLINMNSEYLYYVLGEPNQFTYPTGERIYEEWTPDVVRGSEPVPEEFRNAEDVPGGRFAVWGDLADAQTQEEVAAGIVGPLRAVAQKLWDPAQPELDWAEFTELADRVTAG